MTKTSRRAGITALGLLTIGAILIFSIRPNQGGVNIDGLNLDEEKVISETAQMPTAEIPLPRVVSTPKSLISKATSKDLSPAEIQHFVNEVDRTFSGLVIAGVNEDEINRSLSRLNERREAGARALIRILSDVPSHEKEVRERISMVDYLVYRSRWDEDTRAEVLRLATSEIPASATPKIKGAMIVERSEIIGKIAAIDWDATILALQSLQNPISRRVAATEAVFSLAEHGMHIDEARRKVKEVVPEYVIASKENEMM